MCWTDGLRRATGAGLSLLFIVVTGSACSSDGATDVGTEDTSETTVDVSDDIGTTDLTDDADSNDIDTAGDVPEIQEADGDIDADAADVRDCYPPTEGCPCDPEHDKPCCIYGGYGLECSSFFRSWQSLYDCGCSQSPDCEGYPLYHLCGLE